MNMEEVFAIYKKNAGVLGKGNGIYPTGAKLLGCIQLSGPHDRRASRHEMAWRLYSLQGIELEIALKGRRQGAMRAQHFHALGSAPAHGRLFRK